MCQMLLSIHPEHVKNILTGKKQYEFRKVRCKADVDKIVIYSTAPQKMIVAEAALEEIIEGSIVDVWQQTKGSAGISYPFFRSYYKGKKKAVAYKLGNITIYDEPRSLSDYGLTFAPQSFVYLEVSHSDYN